MQLLLLTSPTLTSAGVNHASAWRIAEMMLRCVSTAPFESPVVPPVYCRNATDSGPESAGRSDKPRPALTAAVNEGLADAIEIRLRDPDACVADGDDESTLRVGGDFDANATPRWQ